MFLSQEIGHHHHAAIRRQRRPSAGHVTVVRHKSKIDDKSDDGTNHCDGNTVLGLASQFIPNAQIVVHSQTEVGDE